MLYFTLFNFFMLIVTQYIIIFRYILFLNFNFADRNDGVR